LPSSTAKLPSHVGIIPDGNRRWARRNGKSLLEAYLYGYRKLVEVSEYLLDRGVRYLSVFSMSYENCVNRDPQEKKIIEEVAVYALRDIRFNQRFRDYGIRLLVLGDPSIFSERVAREASESVRILDGGRGGVLCLLICYSGRWEALHYSRLGMIPPSLLLPPVDLVIRSGSARRLSGFLPVASEFAELYFTDKLWPELALEDIESALEWFSRQKRNFGR
jgi:tritrans,polycis-undecaprenyl-diphosphate synthase [geranylgeranyl-diphosphate specific]